MNTFQYNSVFNGDCYISKKKSSEFSLYTQSTLERWQVSSSEIITPNNVTFFF